MAKFMNSKEFKNIIKEKQKIAVQKALKIKKVDDLRKLSTKLMRDLTGDGQGEAEKDLLVEYMAKVNSVKLKHKANMAQDHHKTALPSRVLDVAQISLDLLYVALVGRKRRSGPTT